MQRKENIGPKHRKVTYKTDSFAWLVKKNRI